MKIPLFVLLPFLGVGWLGAEPSVEITAGLPGGNVRVLDNSGATVKVEPDLRGDRPWFYWLFEAKAIEPGAVTFVLPEKVAGFENGGTGFQGPAISRDGGESWNWMGADAVSGNQFTVEFAKAGETIRLGVTIPYTKSDLESFLTTHDENPHLTRAELTRSSEDRPVDLLRIGEAKPSRQPVLFTGRHHACETMASYVLEGVIEEAMSDSQAGKAFREKYVLFCVPIVDVDGVENGDQGKNRLPHDHNRDYGTESIYPEVRAIRKLDATHDFKLALDFHCPTLVMRDHQVMYFVGAKNQPEHNFDNVSKFAGLIKKGLPADAPSGPLVWLRPAIKPTPMNSHYFGFKEGAVMAATLEIPFAPPGRAADLQSVREYGRAVLRAWVQTEFVGDFKPPQQKTAQRGKQEWLPLGDEKVLTDRSGKLFIPEIAITQAPKPTADATRFEREYVIELERFDISPRGDNAVETSRGLNRALQHAKSTGANRIVFPKGTYLISEADPIVLDHKDTIIDLNGATLRINPNGLPKYSIVEILPAAENLRLTNGRLLGDKNEHDYKTEDGPHAWGHGLIVHGGTNLELDHLTISNVTGDGANTRFTGARDRDELLANIAHSIYAKELEPGAFSPDGQKVEGTGKTRSIEPYDLTKCQGEFEFGYSTGYLGYPFVQGRAYQAFFFDAEMQFVEMKPCMQFRKVTVPAGAKFVHLEFNQPEVRDEPLHSGAGKGSFIGRISNFKGSVDVHFHHNQLIGNRRLGMGYCGGRRWLIEDNLFAENGGVAPSYGIDLEDGWEFMQDVVIRNNRFRDNKAGDLVICAGSELLVEGNVFENNVALHGRPHNYIFRNNRFTGGRVGYKTRTGVARIEGNTYENCSLSIAYDTAALADGLNRAPGEAIRTQPLKLVNEQLKNVTEVSGAYFHFTGATVENTRFIVGQETQLVKFVDCEVRDGSIFYEANGLQWSLTSIKIAASYPNQARV